jgi:putative transposase
MTSPLWGASPSNFLRAEERLSVLRKLDSGEVLNRDEIYSPATIRRWRKSVKEGLTNGISEFESLLDEREDRGFKGPHIDVELSQWLNECITIAISKAIGQTLSASFEEIKKLVSAMGFTMLSKSSFYERASALKTVKTIQNAMGQKHAYKAEPSYWMLNVDTPVHGARALAEVHFDSTLLDVEVHSSLSGDILGRPWLTLAFCGNTRRVVGMHLSFKPPGYISSMMVLADIVRRFGRLPDCVIHDWGSEFKAGAWKFALTALQIERFVRPKSAPRFGAVIERFFGVLTRELLDNIAGNTKLRKAVRSLSPDADPSRHSGLWLLDLAYGFEEYFFDIYDTRKHPTTLMKPRDAFDISILKHGTRLHRLRKLDDLLPLLMPTAKGRPRSIDPSRGVWVNYRYYGHPSLTALSLKGMTLAVKPLPHDPTRILGCIEGKWAYLNSNLSEHLSRVPERVRMCIYEELQLEHLLVASSHALSRSRRTDLIEAMNAKALKNLEYWKEPEFRRLLATASFDGCPSEVKEIAPPQGGHLQKLDSMMQRAFANVMGETYS